MKKYLLIIICLLTVSVNAKSLNKGKSGGHEADIYAVLPFARSERIGNLIETIHNSIDLPIGYFEGLRSAPHQDFTWHRYGHRVFFHWGFNANPRSSPTLKSLVAERNWSPSVEETFWVKVIEEQARRNRATLNATSQALGFSVSGQQRAYANAFASIIVDVHILGDYSTTNVQSLSQIDMVVADIKKALFESLKGADDAKRINQRLDSTKSIIDNKLRAEAIITLLKSELPSFLLKTNNSFFKQHFVQQGIILK